MRRFASSQASGDSEVVASGRPIQLFEAGFTSAKGSIKECILQAIPGYQFANLIDDWVREHVTHMVQVREAMTEFSLTKLEAEAVAWWSADVSAFGESTEKSPYFIYNSLLRQRDMPSVERWKDFSFFLVSALKKLPALNVTTFRGENKRVTELSRQYHKGNQVS